MSEDIHIVHEFLEYLLEETDVPVEYIDRVQNPSMFSTPRMFKFSMGVNF